MGLLGVCSSVLVNFHLALKSLFKNSERSSQCSLQTSGQAVCAWLNDGILAGKPWSGSVKRVEQCFKSNSTVVELGCL